MSFNGLVLVFAEQDNIFWTGHAHTLHQTQKLRLLCLLFLLLGNVELIGCLILLRNYPLITASENLSISSNCGLHCNKKKSTPTASNSATVSCTWAGVPTRPVFNPRLLTE